MKESYLVQRLRKPYGRDNPFSFGGGLHNGGLSDEAMDLLRGIFSFDYMGASEFEFGAVPKALQEIARNSNEYQVYSFTIPLKKVAKSWRDKSKVNPVGDATIYVICKKDYFGEVKDRIIEWATGPYNSNLKEQTMLSNTLRPDGDWAPGNLGWLELDNGFFFFTDKEMWEKTSALFGLDS